MNKRTTWDSRQWFCMAKKLLGVTWLCLHWRKSEREIYRWTANPNQCAQWRENPLEKILEQNRELDARGFTAAAAAPVHILAEALGLRVVVRSTAPGAAAAEDVTAQARAVTDAFFDALYLGEVSESDLSARLSRAVRGLETAAACYRRRETPPTLYFAAEGAAEVSPFTGGKRPWWKFWGVG